MFSHRQSVRLLAWLTVALLASAVFLANWWLFSVPSPPPPAPAALLPQTSMIEGGNEFTVGVNYPWFQYGRDFGTNGWGHAGVSDLTTAASVNADFADMARQGVKSVRWFLFCDGRVGIKFDSNGVPIGLDDYVMADIESALQIAEKHGIRIIFVLVDFNFFAQPAIHGSVRVGGHADVAQDPFKRQQFLDTVFKPILERFGKNKTVLAWEIINEPEWEMNLTGTGSDVDKVRLSVMREFVRATVQYVHTYSTQLATVGSAKRSWLRFWTKLGLDFYQFHYYPYMELRNPLNYPADKLQLDKPVLLGEFPTKNALRSSEHYLDLSKRNGYAGAFAWSYRATDRYTDYNSARRDISSYIHKNKSRP